MSVRDESGDLPERERSRQRGVSVEREVDVFHAVDGHAVEGEVHEGRPHLRVEPAAPMAHALGAPGGAPPHARPAATLSRLALVAGVATALATTWALPLDEASGVDESSAAALVAGMVVLETLALLVATVAVMWRMRRTLSLPRRVGYVAAVWTMALGVGLVASHALAAGSAVVYDAGLLLLLLVAASDERLRHARGRRRHG